MRQARHLACRQKIIQKTGRFIYHYGINILTVYSLAYIITDPEALRSAVLMAGTHFAFNVGSLQDFELTFLHHKIETVRRVRDWVSRQDPKLVAEITKQIVTLAYTEVCSDIYLVSRMRLMISDLPW